MRPKDIGTRAESAVRDFLQVHGFPHCERKVMHGAFDRGDLDVCPGVIAEVKGGEAAKSASDGQVDIWVAETERERVNAGAALAVLVMQRSRKNVRDWWAAMTLSIGGDNYVVTRMRLFEAVKFLRSAGYGDPL